MSILNLMKKTISKKIIFAFFMALALLNIAAYCQNNSDKKEFDNKSDSVEIDWGERAEIIDHPVYGIIILSKDRWKNWVFRSLIIIMIYLSVMVVVVSIPKNSEMNLIISYLLCGSVFVISFWETLSGWMLTRLNSYKYGWSFIFIAIAMYIASYFAIMRVKRYDISYAQIREEFKKMQSLNTNEDQRLIPISGVAGEWEDEDFVNKSK